MDTLKPAPAPSQLLHDLESIRALLDEPQADAEPPLLTESITLDSIPLLSEIVAPHPRPYRLPRHALTWIASCGPPHN